MAANPQPTDLSDAALRQILLLLAQGISPSRLRPEPINIARSLLGTEPDPEGVFGDIFLELRRRGHANEPSYAEEIISEAENWLAKANLSNHPIGLTVGCFPSGIESGCRKHLECPTAIEENCPFRDDEAPASIELKRRWYDKDEDIMPVLRRCQFLGCVRPQKARAWLDEQRHSTGAPDRRNDRREASVRVRDLTTALVLGDKNSQCSTAEAADHLCLDSLCPHFRRSWQEPVVEANNQLVPADRLNQHRFLQCSLSRPWPVYGFDPAKPTAKRHFDAAGLPISFSSIVPGLDVLPLPHGFTELPVLWLRHAGFSGVGVVVVDEAEKEKGVYYLQMGSRVPLLRDYYEMPYFWLGERVGEPWPEVVREHLAQGRPQYIQCLFRAHRPAASDPTHWEPELLEIFRDTSARRLAPFGRGRFLYCPDGEVSFFLLCWRLMRLMGAVEEGDVTRFEEELFDEFKKIASEEIWTDQQPNQPPERDLAQIFRTLLYLPADSEPWSLRDELINLGLVAAVDRSDGQLQPTSSGAGSDVTPRLRSLIAWLLHFRERYGDRTRTDSFIPTEFLDTHPPAGVQGWLSFPDIVTRIGSDMPVGRPNLSPSPRCLTHVLEQLNDVPSDNEASDVSLRRVVAAIVSVIAEKLEGEQDRLATLEQMIRQLLRRARVPMPGYYAWRSSGTRDFCLGHFAAPIGQGNPVTSREEHGEAPWREDQFFLAGIDEVQLSGEKMPFLFNPFSESAARLGHDLENVALLGRVLFSPLSDSTINYTIFQRRLQNLRAQEARAAEFRAHQTNSFILPMMTMLQDSALWADPALKQNLLSDLTESLQAIYFENSIYLDVAKGEVSLKDAIRQDYRKHNVGDFIHNVVKKYEKWATAAKQRQRQKPVTVVVEPVDGASTFPASYLTTILWELINNHQKHAPDDATTAIVIHASVEKSQIRIVVADSSDVPKEYRKVQKGWSVGQDALRRILRFMMRYDTHRESPYEPRFGYDASGLRYESEIVLDLTRLAARFAPGVDVPTATTTPRSRYMEGGGRE